MGCRLCQKTRAVGRRVVAVVRDAVPMRKAAPAKRRRTLADAVNERRQDPVSRHSPEGFDEVLEGREE